jgi:hypothetical protein
VDLSQHLLWINIGGGLLMLALVVLLWMGARHGWWHDD